MFCGCSDHCLTAMTQPTQTGNFRLHGNLTFLARAIKDELYVEELWRIGSNLSTALLAAVSAGCWDLLELFFQKARADHLLDLPALPTLDLLDASCVKEKV